MPTEDLQWFLRWRWRIGSPRPEELKRFPTLYYRISTVPLLEVRSAIILSGCDSERSNYENTFIRAFRFDGRFRCDGGPRANANSGCLQSRFEGVVKVKARIIDHRANQDSQ